MGHDGMMNWGPSNRRSNLLHIGDLEMNVELGDIESRNQTSLKGEREERWDDGSGRSLVGVAR
jgi:hypothetical protein